MITCLIQSQEPLRKIELLLEIGQFTSEPIKQALILHLVKGYATAAAYQAASVPQQNFNRALARLNQLYCKVAEVNEL